jgi:hypothetical protein
MILESRKYVIVYQMFGRTRAGNWVVHEKKRHADGPQSHVRWNINIHVHISRTYLLSFVSLLQLWLRFIMRTADLGDWKLGIDVGGTFTDAVLYRENTGEIYKAKVLPLFRKIYRCTAFRQSTGPQHTRRPE